MWQNFCIISIKITTFGKKNYFKYLLTSLICLMLYIMVYKLKIYTFLFGNLDYNDKIVIIIPDNFGEEICEVDWVRRTIVGRLIESQLYDQHFSVLWPKCNSYCLHRCQATWKINATKTLWRRYIPFCDELQTTNTLFIAISHWNLQRMVTWEWLRDNLRGRRFFMWLTVRLMSTSEITVILHRWTLLLLRWTNWFKHTFCDMYY